MKTSEELRFSAQIQAQLAADELKLGGGGKTLTSLTRVKTQLRVALAAVTELENRALGIQPPKEGK